MDTSFSRPFHCPECKRSGLTEAIIDGRQAWSAHTEKVHGKAHSPNWILKPLPKKYQCFLCPSEFVTTTKLFSHINSHIHSNSVKGPVDCLTCTQSTSIPVTLQSLWEWLEHLRDFHEVSALFCILCGHSGLTRHMDGYHKADFEIPFPCPACERQSGSQLHNMIDGPASWHLHLLSVHREWGYAGTGWAATSCDERCDELDHNADSTMEWSQLITLEGNNLARDAPCLSPKPTGNPLALPLPPENSMLLWPNPSDDHLMTGMGNCRESFLVDCDRLLILRTIRLTQNYDKAFHPS